MDEDELELKGHQISNLKKNPREKTTDDGSGHMEADIEEIDDAAKKVREFSIQKWIWFQEADSPRRTELKRKRK